MAEPYEHPALPPDAGPHAGSVGGRRPGPGTVLQQSLPAVTAASVAAATAAREASEPEWWRRMPTPYKAFVQLGLLGMFVVLFAVYFWDNRAAIQRAEDERRLRDAEERDIRRAEQAQQDRRTESLVSEIRGMRNSFDAILSEHRSANTEMRNSSRLLERLSKELQALVDKVAGGAKETGRSVFDLLDLDPMKVVPVATPESAPTPHGVSPPAPGP